MGGNKNFFWGGGVYWGWGIFLGGGNEQIFGWWRGTPPLPSPSRKNPDVG